MSNAQKLSQVVAGGVPQYFDKDEPVAITGGTLSNVTVSALISMNPSTLTTDTTIPTGYNAYSAGPLTIGEGTEVTLNDQSQWSIL